MDFTENDRPSCWYKSDTSQFKVFNNFVLKHKIDTYNCSNCSNPIISESYQAKYCGSRYCSKCYNNIKDKYYCNICKTENPDNVVHNKKDIFVDLALMKHLKNLEVECPDCNEKISVVELESHVNTCNLRYSYCEICSKKEENKQTQIKENSNQSGPQFCQLCGKECLDISLHKNECLINWEKTCPYNCVKSKIMKDHKIESYLDHLDMAWSVFVSSGLTECKRANSLKFKELVKTIIDTVRVSFNLKMDELDNLSRSTRSFRECINKENESFKSIQNLTTSEISDTIFTSFDGTILWRIDNFSELQLQAKMGADNNGIFSVPFYTSRFGYKMCLRLYPNGDSSVRNKSISLFFVLMKGAYDNLLRWPFKQNITFILLDQDFKSNLKSSFKPLESSHSFSRPTCDMNIPSGISHFISLDDFYKSKYLKDNTIFIRCIVDCADLHE